MIITRTPFRVSFFGGGTDYPAWYREHGGSVLSTSINRYCYITCRRLPPFFDHKHRIVYSIIESVKNNHDIVHPSVRNVFEWANVTDGLEIHHDGDLPARSGLGSSSSFTVGLLHALTALKGEIITKEKLAMNAIHIEQNLIKENVGSQDQISAAFGGFNRIDFKFNDTFEVSPIVLPSEKRKELSNHLMLIFSGFSRLASTIAKSQIDNIKNKHNELKMMQSMVSEAIKILQNKNEPIESFGKLLDESWRYKRSLSDRVSSPEIDELYNVALRAGAIGGKILGAGGGGFLLLFAKPEIQPKIKILLNNLIHVPFDFEDDGSKIVSYYPNGI
jgi:D-glycero-alpha-D-manno-heptose-7-phosphate kinase